VQNRSKNSIKKGLLSANGPASNLAWSDPGEDHVMGGKKSPRGTGFLYGPDVTDQFNHTNKIEFIYRAHQLAMNGYS